MFPKAAGSLFYNILVTSFLDLHTYYKSEAIESLMSLLNRTMFPMWQIILQHIRYVFSGSSHQRLSRFGL